MGTPTSFREQRRERAAKERVKRFRDNAEKGASGVRAVLYVAAAVIIGALTLLGGVLPWLFGGLLSGASVVVLAFGAVLAGAGVWFRRTSDSKAEKMTWLVVVAIALAGMAFWIGGM